MAPYLPEELQALVEQTLKTPQPTTPYRPARSNLTASRSKASTPKVLKPGYLAKAQRARVIPVSVSSFTALSLISNANKLCSWVA